MIRRRNVMEKTDVGKPRASGDDPGVVLTDPAGLT